VGDTGSPAQSRERQNSFHQQQESPCRRAPISSNLVFWSVPTCLTSQAKRPNISQDFVNATASVTEQSRETALGSSVWQFPLDNLENHAILLSPI